jgi:hypothetical protein
MTLLYFLAEEPVKDSQQQDCCLIVEISRSLGAADKQWVKQLAKNALKEKFSKKLTLWSVNEDEALQYLKADSGASTGALILPNNISVIWHLVRII